MSGRPQCSGEWISGSGGHREHTHCENLATFWDDDDMYAYCDSHIKDHDRADYRNRYVTRGPDEKAERSFASMIAHGETYALGRYRGQEEERAAVVELLRSSVWTGSAFPPETHAAVAQIANAIERGEHRKAER